MNGVQRCVLYARLSVSKEESVSIDRQLLAGRKYAEGRGWEVVGEFVDDGVSATANRPEDRSGWAALLAASDYDAVVIWKVDRLARRVLDFLQVDEELQARGAGLVAVEDPIDMTSPMGRAFATILAVFGEMEAEAIAARVKAARAHIIADGRWAGGGVPYGYMVVDNPDGPGRVLVKDPDRIGWLAGMVERAQTGDTVDSIARWLDAEHAPVPRTRRSGRQTWNRQTVRGLLRNPVLAGMTPRNPGRKRSSNDVDPMAVLRDEGGEPVVNSVLAVITVDEFTGLLDAMDSRGTPQARKFTERRRTSPLLSKVAVCDDCDRFMCRGTNQGKPTLYCPVCRQTLSRSAFDPYLEGRLIDERGDEPFADSTVAACWQAAGLNVQAKRHILLSQIYSLRIRRGVVGRYFDEDRVLLVWRERQQEPVDA